MNNHNQATATEHQDKATETAIEQQAEGNWKQFKGRIQEAWGVLTDDEVDQYQGKREQLIGRIQEKTGEAREAVARKLNDLAQKVRYRF